MSKPTQQIANLTNEKAVQPFAGAERDIEYAMLDRYGPLLGGSALRKVLGYPSAAALRRSLERGSVTVPVFKIANRRGHFALTQDVAAWLHQCRTGALHSTTPDPKEGTALQKASEEK